MSDFIYDIEVYPNVFLLCIFNPTNQQSKVFEISHRRNDLRQLHNHIEILKLKKARMVGFNNIGYDYPVLHALLQPKYLNRDHVFLNKLTYSKSDLIVNGDWDKRFEHIIWDNLQEVPQVDLFKIHHFDNAARATSLKILEFNMRSSDIKELPFPPGKELNDNEVDELIKYNKHDVSETYKFYVESKEQIEFRESLTKKYNRNHINYNDTKIGKELFITRLTDELGKEVCYKFIDGKRTPTQTPRDSINVGKIIFKYVQFKSPEFQAVLKVLNSLVLKETKGSLTGLDPSSLGDLIDFCDKKTIKGAIKNLNVIYKDFKFVFGTGGLHGSIEPTTVYSDLEFVICDLDVISYYPSLSITNRIYPEHLTDKFCDINADIKRERATYKKGTVENVALKLALNGTYGDTNNHYSPFYDPKYTMAITINGQLLLCMLVESLMTIDGLKMIQANTDGITVLIKRSDLCKLKELALRWEFITGLELETAFYSRMFIRDVNNYIAEYEGTGELKRKGAYEYELGWHQNQSCLVVQKAVEAYLVKGVDVETFIKNHDDEFDFFLRTKVPRTSRLILRTCYNNPELNYDEQIQNVSRYYISNSLHKLVKVMPPLKNKTNEREISINKEWNVTICNGFYMDDELRNINYNFYINEAMKMIKPLNNRFDNNVDYVSEAISNMSEVVKGITLGGFVK